MKNTRARSVRKRTSGSDRPGTRDRRVERTKASLHDALIGLAREKPYPAIAVKEILDRANVGRSTFYTHFSDKDDLLDSGIHEMVRSASARPRTGGAVERIVAFSRPFLEHLGEHRHESAPGMRWDGRGAMHSRLEHVLSELMEDLLGAEIRRLRLTTAVPVAIVARYVASTFVLVLNAWVAGAETLTPLQVDARFRHLVLPTLSVLLGPA